MSSIPDGVRGFDMNVAQGENMVIKDYKKWPAALPVRLHVWLRQFGALMHYRS